MEHCTSILSSSLLVSSSESTMLTFRLSTPTKPTSTGGHGGSGGNGASTTAGGQATGSSVAEGPGATTAPQLAMGVLAMFVGYVFAL
jgi:hypothetical protein